MRVAHLVDDLESIFELCVALAGEADDEIARQGDVRPGLAIDQLESRQDLRVTLDYRDVLAEIVQNRLGNSQLAQVFPGWTPTFRGVTR